MFVHGKSQGLGKMGAGTATCPVGVAVPWFPASPHTPGRVACAAEEATGGLLLVP